MKYFAALSLVSSLVAATSHETPAAAAASTASAQPMQVMTVQPAAAAGAVTHTVVVGGLKPVETGMAPIFGYSPEAIVAAQGDVVKFVFMQKNHTVTQSTFDDPCKKMDGGMDSGFKPNPMGMSGPEFEWEMTVPSTDPLWFYCKQKTGNHCGIGMVFSINAKTAGEKTMAQFKQLAINKNGTAVPLEPAGIQQVNPGAQAAPSTVTIQAGGGAGAVATATGSAAAGTASVVAGQGTDQQGNACTCHCLCGINSFPAQAAINNFGGFAGSIAAL